MRKTPIKNMAASVRDRLLQISKKSRRDFNAVLLQYFQERFLFRLSISKYKNSFVLKGAVLFLAYNLPRLRPTKDMDFLGIAIPNDLESIRSVIQKISQISAIDGVIFHPQNMSVKSIAEDKELSGRSHKVGRAFGERQKNFAVRYRLW